jgi:hypothetical protein
MLHRVARPLIGDGVEPVEIDRVCVHDERLRAQEKTADGFLISARRGWVWNEVAFPVPRAVRVVGTIDYGEVNGISQGLWSV